MNRYYITIAPEDDKTCKHYIYAMAPFGKGAKVHFCFNAKEALNFLEEDLDEVMARLKFEFPDKIIIAHKRRK